MCSFIVSFFQLFFDCFCELSLNVFSAIDVSFSLKLDVPCFVQEESNWAFVLQLYIFVSLKYFIVFLSFFIFSSYHVFLKMFMCFLYQVGPWSKTEVTRMTVGNVLLFLELGLN